MQTLIVISFQLSISFVTHVFHYKHSQKFTVAYQLIVWNVHGFLPFGGLLFQPQY